MNIPAGFQRLQVSSRDITSAIGERNYLPQAIQFQRSGDNTSAEHLPMDEDPRDNFLAYSTRDGRVAKTILNDPASADLVLFRHYPNTGPNELMMQKESISADGEYVKINCSMTSSLITTEKNGEVECYQVKGKPALQLYTSLEHDFQSQWLFAK